MMSPLVADCELPSTGSDCGALRGCSSGGGEGSSSGGSPSVDADCEMENEAVEACIVAAARAGAPFEFSNSNLNGSGQYGWVGSISVGADGARSEKDYEYYDLCAEVRAELYGPATLTDCDDFTCVEDRLRAAEHVRSCGPEEQCGI